MHFLFDETIQNNTILRQFLHVGNSNLNLSDTNMKNLETSGILDLKVILKMYLINPRN